MAEIDTVGKAARLLDLLSREPQGATLMQLSRSSGFPASSAHRLLASLRRDGLVELEPVGRRYALGLRLFQMGAAVAARRGFAGTALPVLREVSAATGESTLLSVLDDDTALCVHHVRAQRSVGVREEVGTRDPLHASAPGKALLACSPPERRLALTNRLRLVALTPRTLTTRETLVADLDATRARGWAVADEEAESGVRAVSVPVVSGSRQVVAAVTTSCPAYRTTVAGIERFLPALHDAAQRLAVLLPDA